MIIKYFGALYLIYINVKGLRAKKSEISIDLNHNISRDISALSGIRSGFLNGILNPKAMFFFISLFSVMIDKETSAFELSIYAVMIFCQSLTWFSIVSFCFSREIVRKKFSAVGYWIDRVTGCVLILLGCKLFFFKKD